MSGGTRMWMACSLVLLALLVVCGVGCSAEEPQPQQAGNDQQLQQEPLAPPGMAQFQAGKAGQLAALELPKPRRFRTKDGRSGWKLQIPGGRPLATPAVVDGVLYVGGGFGSHEFYAVNASTGEAVWTFQTGDDGPTAAVVDEGCVAYNTESCTLYVQNARTGKVLWSKWLGDPLMSQPAAADGRLFMAYPGQDDSHHLVAFRLKTGKVLWDQKIAAEVISAPVIEGDSVYAATVDGTLYGFDAATGKLHWKRQANVTSAPRIADGKVYISQRAVRTVEIAAGEGTNAKKESAEATFEGLNVADARTGRLAFKEPQAAVRASYLLTADGAYTVVTRNASLSFFGQASAYAIAGDLGEDFFGDASGEEVQRAKDALAELKSAKPSDNPDVAQSNAERAAIVSDALEKAREAIDSGKAPELKGKEKMLDKVAMELRSVAGRTRGAALAAKEASEMRVAIEKEQKSAQAQDTSVGFASVPEAANLEPAMGNIGQGNVKAVWAFQGSRPNILGGRCISLNGARFRCIDAASGKVGWEAELKSKADATRPASPPALAGGKLYLGTADGRLLCADPKTGKTLWETEVGGRILFEPAVVNGRVYLATNEGMLICVETGDKSADGWAMWGASARHNGPVHE